jgi:predicted GNAT superfamily acetyltransferase
LEFCEAKTVQRANREEGASMSATVQSGEISIRHCHGLSEFQQCFELQRAVWGKTELDVPLPLFVVAAETGGQVLGAFIREKSDGEIMVGFTLAIAGYRNGLPFLHSHMTAVLENYRDRGIGRRLKLFQREDALQRGIRLVEWTFDPLEVKNAFLNFNRLGAIARRYLPNCYGVTTSPLHGGMPTDRLIAEWWLDSPRVINLLNGGQQSVPQSSNPRAEILVPAELPLLRRENSSEALRIQTEVREKFQSWIAKGYAATTIEITGEGGKYILEPWSKSPEGTHTK